MARAEKVAIVESLQSKMSGTQALFIADYRGLKVGELTELRARLRESGAELQVVKNTLARRAADAASLPDMGGMLTGPTAIAFAGDDVVAPAKVLHEFSQAHQALEIKGGLLEGKIVEPGEVEALAKLPSREVLLAQVVGGLQAPISGLAGVLSGLLRNLVYVLDAVRTQKEAA